MKWQVWKQRCRHHYRCCPEVWWVTPPHKEDDFVISIDFPTWERAMGAVNAALATATN